MMQFFRKYQRIFFIVLTVIIIASFSFFGTYSAFASREVDDPVMVSHERIGDVRASEMGAWERFLGSDAEDKWLSGGVWGPNFLNDGVLKKDFLQTGLAEEVAEPFIEKLGLSAKVEREKRFTGYVHPKASFVSAEAAWNLFAPKINEQLQVLKKAQDEKALLGAKVALYLEERKFPAPFLRQVLMYQQGQYEWIVQDPALQQKDLSLFGYHTLEDWFGPHFLRLCAQVVMHSAKVAEAKGFKITEQEALQDLFFNAEMSFLQMQKMESPHLDVRNVHEYFQEQLRLLGIDQKMAAKIWRQVMLFRLLASGPREAVLVDPLVVGDLHNFAGKNVEVQLYQMKAPFRFAKEQELQKFDTYLSLVAEREDPLVLPEKFKSVEEVAPELVYKKYEVRLAHVNAKELHVPLKKLWEYELDENNWPSLMLQVPELGRALAKTREERLQALDHLDEKTRFVVDRIAKDEMVAKSPDLIQTALDEKNKKEMAIKIHGKGAKVPLQGISDVKAFQEALESQDLLDHWTQDGKNFYTIEMIKRDPEAYIASFEEAHVEAFQKERDFAPLYERVLAEAKESGFEWNQEGGQSKGDFAAQHFFVKHLAMEKEAGHLDAEEAGSLQLVEAFEKGRAKASLQEQFALEKSTFKVSRKEGEEAQPFFDQPEGAVSKVLVSSKRGVYFYKVLKIDTDPEGQREMIERTQELLGAESAGLAMREVIKTLKDDLSL